MRQVESLIVIVVLVAILIIPNGLVVGEKNKLEPEIISSGHYEKGYRYNVQGWIYIHIEGEPYERGYQYGYLAAAEIVDMINRLSKFGSHTKIMGLFTVKTPEQWWNICKSKAMRTFWKYYPEEYKQEIKGIADSVRARGGAVHGHDVEYEDIIMLNEFVDCWFSYTNFWKKFHPIRGIINWVKHLLSGTQLEGEGFCSAFIATGDATRDGGIVATHSTAPILYFMERMNVILDVQPSKGHRFTLTSKPGMIWSAEDYYQNDRGIILIETTLPQGPWNERGIPIAVRTRKAIQYSDSIDDVLEILLDGNNGLYPCEWLIGDTKTREIASIELALYNTPIKRTFNGFYWSCNVPHDLKVQGELYGVPPIFLRIASKIRPDLFAYPIAEKFMELEERYYGEIDTEIAKKIMSTYPICKSRTDCKITDSKLMENLGLLAFMGNPNGSLWNPTDEAKKKYSEITELPPSGWLELYSSNSKPKSLSLTGSSSNKGKNSRVLWQYETDDTGNIDYSSSIVSGDTVYAAASSGAVYALNASRGKLIWKRDVGERSVTPAVLKDLVFAGTERGVHAINRGTGEVKWEQLVGGISSKPVVVNDLVIVSCSDENIYAFDADSGKIAWVYELPGSTAVSEAQNGAIYMCSGDTCYAFDIDNRELVWEYETDGEITTPPIVNGDTVYVGSWDGNIYALDSIDGDLKWRYETGWGIDTTPAVSDGMVFVGSNDNIFYALDANSGELEWFFTCKAGIHSSPVVYGEYVFFGSDDGRLYALNKINGCLAWSFTPEYYIKDDDVNNYITTPILSNPVVENGVVYIGAKGNIYALDAQTVETREELLEEKPSIPDYVFIFLIGLGITLLLISLLIHLYYKRKDRMEK